MTPLADQLLVNGFIIVGGSPAAVFARNGLAAVCCDIATARAWAADRKFGGLFLDDHGDGTAAVRPARWYVEVGKRNGHWRNVGSFERKADAETAYSIARLLFKRVNIGREQ